jgi:hypothetical protein
MSKKSKILKIGIAEKGFISGWKFSGGSGICFEINKNKITGFTVGGYTYEELKEKAKKKKVKK